MAKRTVKREAVNHPAHYNRGNIECIDAAESMLTREGFLGALQFQVLKYNWRQGQKGQALEDAKKAQWYQNRIVSTLEKAETRKGRKR